MGKLKRYTVGSVYRPKEEGQEYYMKLSCHPKVKEELVKALANADEKKGLYLRLESKKFQTKSLEAAVDDGKLSEDIAEQIQERIDKIPDYVYYEIVLLTE